MLKASDEIKNQLVNKVREITDEETAELLRQGLNGNDKWTVEFRIIDTRRSNGNFDIPFFSKLSLKDEGQKIHVMSMIPKVGFIECADQ